MQKMQIKCSDMNGKLGVEVLHEPAEHRRVGIGGGGFDVAWREPLALLHDALAKNVVVI